NAKANDLDTMPCDTSFPTALRALSGVRGVACASGSIADGRGFLTKITGPEGGAVDTGLMVVDFGFFDLLRIPPLAGRTFSGDFGGDAVPQDGSRITPPSVVVKGRPTGPLAGATGAAIRAASAAPDAPSQIVGVVPDIARGSVRQAIQPM